MTPDDDLWEFIVAQFGDYGLATCRLVYMTATRNQDTRQPYWETRREAFRWVPTDEKEPV